MTSGNGANVSLTDTAPGGEPWAAQGRLNRSPSGAQFTVRRSWEKMGLVGTFPKGTSRPWQYSANKRLDVGGAVVSRRKSWIEWFLCRHIRLLPAALDPRELGCRVASACLIIDRDVPRCRAADVVCCSGGRGLSDVSSNDRNGRALPAHAL